jgi:uncharacterized protein YecE (DUF72 family)
VVFALRGKKKPLDAAELHRTGGLADVVIGLFERAHRWHAPPLDHEPATGKQRSRQTRAHPNKSKRRDFGPWYDASMKFWIGTSGFQYAEWKGNFYPEKLPASKMLSFYAERFPTTEINYTFRRIPSGKTIESWYELTPEQFAFSLKAPQRVTHFAKLKNSGDTMNYLFGVIQGLEHKLGPLLFQLPPSFKRDAPLLSAFLGELPKGIRAAFEFRHASWFEDEIFESLRAHNAALCIAESENLCTPSVATARFGYLRLRRQDYNSTDILRWADFLRSNDGKWSDAFVYFKHEESGEGPRLAAEMIQSLGLDRSE